MTHDSVYSGSTSCASASSEPARKCFSDAAYARPGRPGLVCVEPSTTSQVTYGLTLLGRNARAIGETVLLDQRSRHRHPAVEAEYNQVGLRKGTQVDGTRSPTRSRLAHREDTFQ